MPLETAELPSLWNEAAFIKKPLHIDMCENAGSVVVEVAGQEKSCSH